ADRHGLVSLAWGLALNAVLAVALPAAVLFARGGRVRRHSVPLELRRRLGRLLLGAAVPLAVQGIYVIGLRFAAGTGTGNVTSLLIPSAAAGVVVDSPISVAARAWWGLTGVAFAMGLSLPLIVLGLMAALSRRTLTLALAGLLRLSALVGAATALAFGGASLL